MPAPQPGPGQRYDRVAVVVPCHDEEATVGAVVRAFLQALPGCSVTVVDNASRDDTAARAAAAGAHVLREPRPGKGFAVRRLFSDVEADCLLMVDGDATYDAAAAPELVALVLDEGVDMAVGARRTREGSNEAYRPGHRFGNWLLTALFRRLFRFAIQDALSGYRAFSRRFVKSFPSMASGFEIEAELNAHAASTGAAYAERWTHYCARPPNSFSKLDTYRDGARILRRNLRLFRDWRPQLSFGLLAVPWFLLSVLLLVPVLQEYVRIGIVPRFPSLIAAVGCFLVALNLVVAGAVLERTARNRVEAVRLAYLALPGPQRGRRSPPTSVSVGAGVVAAE